MKVGVFFNSTTPEAGGGHTFEYDLLQSLIEVSAGSPHTFVIFTTGEGTYEKIAAPNIQNISLQRNVSLRTRVRSKLNREVANLLSKFRGGNNQYKQHKSSEDAILHSGVEIMWYLTPGYITMELPFIAVVWDLQHRLQPYFPEVSSAGEWEGREQFYGMMLRRASAIISGTDVGKREIERFYQVPSERIRILPHPTPQFALSAPEIDSKKTLTKYGIPHGFLFYPAQFWPHKNHVGLILALRILRDKHGLVLPLVFVGSDKGNQPYIRKFVGETGLSQQIYFLGFVPQEDLISLYRESFALTYLTFFGPENLPPLEAFALGCPVIASNVSGAQEQLGNAALLVNPKEPEEIASAIKRLYEDAVLRDTLIHRGKERATKWNGRDYVKAVLSIIDEFNPIIRCWDRSTLEQRPD
jgi:glycosyltransferase involved in cell wall biosynthesis